MGKRGINKRKEDYLEARHHHGKGGVLERKELEDNHTDYFFFLWRWIERTQVTDYLIDIGQKISDGLVKIMHLGEVETIIKSGIKSKSGIMSFQYE